MTPVLRKIGQLGVTGLVKEVRRRRIAGTTRALAKALRRSFFLLKSIGAESYRDPTAEDLRTIEISLSSAGIVPKDYRVDLASLTDFQTRFHFPPEYHGGQASGVFEEKLLEHYVAWALLDLKPGQSYLDIAGASSPWVSLLTKAGIDAYCVDLVPPSGQFDSARYLTRDATNTGFPNGYFDAASAQCAFEMFEGLNDIRLLAEIHRILKPGGRFLVLPLYMHTHACFYQSPEYWRKPHGDPGAKGYIRRDAWNVPSSRKYTALTLDERILRVARNLALQPTLFVLRNRTELPGNIYLHFILALDKPRTS